MGAPPQASNWINVIVLTVAVIVISACDLEESQNLTFVCINIVNLTITFENAKTDDTRLSASLQGQTAIFPKLK